jgi:hypothetical protein
MRHQACGAVVTAAGWSDLADELDRWEESERFATLWWRDDDTAAPSRALEHLLAIAGDVPIALAVIPALADSGLGAWLARSSRSASEPRLAVLQHGWRHANHAVDGKKSEFPAGRRYREVASDLAAGRTWLRTLLGKRALPVLVPPWNRFDASFLTLLPACGFVAISRAKPRRAASPAPELAEVNIHVDLVAWHRNRAFIGEQTALGSLVGHLQARRRGGVDAGEPTGILTHHLVQDEATDEFLVRLIATTGAHPVARWLKATEVFAQPKIAPG